MICSYVGIFAQNGPIWKNSRKFAVVSMRDFGVGKTSLEEKICSEVLALKASIRTENGKAFNLKDKMSRCVANIICQICFNKR